MPADRTSNAKAAGPLSVSTIVVGAMPSIQDVYATDQPVRMHRAGDDKRPSGYLRCMCEKGVYGFYNKKRDAEGTVCTVSEELINGVIRSKIF